MQLVICSLLILASGVLVAGGLLYSGKRAQEWEAEAFERYRQRKRVSRAEGRKIKRRLAAEFAPK